MTTGPVNNNQGANIDLNMVKRSGIQFGKDTLKSLEEVSIYNTKGRTYQKKYSYNIELTNGTQVSLPQQQPGAKIEIDGEYTNFEKLQNAHIDDTEVSDNYNLFGCSNTSVFVFGDSKHDEVRIGDHPDGTKSENNSVRYDESDTIEFAGRANFHGHPGSAGEDSDSLIHQKQYDTGREVIVEDGKPTKTYSREGKLLKDSYVNAKEEKLPGGYTVKTSIDGEERWYFDPKGKQISEEQFNNRPAWFKE